MRVPDQPAYVLHARPWRETSLIVELLTRDQGRVGLVARGVQGPKRHPLRAALQPQQQFVDVKGGELRTELAGVAPLAWTLRRFERDLLELLGYGLPLHHTDDGEPLDPAARYLLDGERGPLRDHRHARGSVSGAALLALADDRMPPPAQLAELRPALRGVLQGHLGGMTLKSWGLMADLAGLRRD